ncbi:hypothetical protein [Amycolatopsis sp. NPDC051128]|uniref:hypothetical protein n=1 Tax=Amycolatopsis sp. NPDC051128 TaxID=3155412 RepID=UPI00342A339C
MTTYPERPNPPTAEVEHLKTAEARHDLDEDTWVGLTPHDKVPREPVVVLFVKEEKSPTGRRR